MVHEHGLEPLDHENSPEGERMDGSGSALDFGCLRQVIPRRAIPVGTYVKGCPWSLLVSCTKRNAHVIRNKVQQTHCETVTQVELLANLVTERILQQ